MTTVVPVTPDRWDDLQELFGASGAYANCWCTWWRLSARQFDQCRREQRRELLQEQVARGREPGLLAYREDRPVGWVAVAPRSVYPRLNRSPHTRPVDEVPVWSITCFWVPRAMRGSGIASVLLDAAVDHAARAGAPAVEGYPVDPAARAVAADQAYTGTVAMFVRPGFTEAARRTPTARAVMRRTF